MKKAKISRGENCDYISRLPDPILHRILGLLNIKEVVQTCVLSKRWEQLWTSLPSLDLSYINNFLDFSDDSDDDCGEESMSTGRFVKFVNALLLRRKPLDLDVVHLCCSELGSNSAVRDWICYAMNHNTRVLHLSSSNIMPWSTYTWTSLEKLYLYGPHGDSSVQIRNLPNLKKLSIFFAYLDSNYVKNFLSGCPKLEYLKLDSCNFTDCVIAHEYIIYLVISTCKIKEELFVSSPNLLSFSYEGELSLPCKTTLNMPSLEQSLLNSCDPPSLFQINKIRCDSSMIKCLEGMATCLSFLTNVELLELHFERQHKEMLASVLSLELPVFPNLKDVTVAFDMFSCFQMVTSIVKSLPKLEKLTILQKGCLSPGEEEASTNESTNVSLTIAFPPHKKLKIVEVKYWKYNQMVRRLVDNLMNATMEFENLKIHWSKYKSSRQY